jgi:hypothetical protein
MKVQDLFEGGRFVGHTYEMGNYPTSRERGLSVLYTSILPHLSKVFKVPIANFKVQTDWGFGFSTGRHAARPFSTEKCLMRVVLRKKGLDVELISKLLPKVLKAYLDKTFKDAHVEVLQVVPETTIVLGKETRVPPFIELRFTTKYPDEWVQWDKGRYGIK